MSDLLLDEAPLVILPSLARLVGLNESIVLQQVHYWLRNNQRARRADHFIDGRWWTYNTYEEWQEQFTFWSARTIRRTLETLESAGLVLTGQHSRDRRDRTKWYTIDYGALDALVANASGQIGHIQEGQADPMHEDNLATSLTETPSETKQTEESPPLTLEERLAVARDPRAVRPRRPG